MKGKLKWIVILIISLLMTVITLLFLQKYLSEETERRIQQAEPEGQSVVVFARPMEADEQVYAEAVAVRDFPQHLVSSQWLSSSEIAELLGQRLKYAVKQGEPLTRAMLISNNFAGLSRQLPKDHYAVTLSSVEGARHNGLLAVGDRVDVVFYTHLPNGQREQRSFTDLAVFDLGSEQQNYAATTGITLLVPEQQIREFTHFRTDEYSLWVRPTSLAENSDRWQPVTPPTRVLSWTGEQP